jgi:hypothetical protein
MPHVIESETRALGVNPFGNIASGFVKSKESCMYSTKQCCVIHGLLENSLLATRYIPRFDDKM